MKNFKNSTLMKAMTLMSVVMLTSACNNSDEYFKKVEQVSPIEIEKDGGDGVSVVDLDDRQPVREPDEAPTRVPPSDEPASGPIAGPILNPVEEPAKEPVSEPVKEPASEPSKVPASEPVKEPASEPSKEPVSEPVKEPASGPSKVPASEPVKEPASEPSKEPASEPVKEPASEPSKEPASEPSKEPTSEPVKDPAIDPVVEVPAKEPVLGPIKDEICNKEAEACDLTPKVTKVGVVTILLALGDLVNDKVVITEGSARLIAQNAVKFASPVAQPKILVVKDHNHNGESNYDTEYIAKVLLGNYSKVDMVNETYAGLKVEDFDGYDLVWFNNPGHEMGSVKTYKALQAFKGGVILSGDDLTQGKGFSTEGLTGLKFQNNGTEIKCGGKKYYYDDNLTSNRYQVSISTQFLPGIPEDLRNFEYGNDIDKSILTGAPSKYEVLATAKGAQNTCTEDPRPVIVRYAK